MTTENTIGDKSKPKIGVGILILNDKQEVLLGLRTASHGTGEWSFPGGHLEFGETVFETARHEVKEETDLEICYGCELRLLFLGKSEGWKSGYTRRL